MVGVGPSALGEFHPEAVRQMKAAGAWLKVNGEAIYATRPRDGGRWAEGEQVRFTRSKDRRFTFAILTKWPGAEIALATVRPKEGSRIAFLGSEAALDWRFDSSRGTIINLPEKLQTATNRPCEYAWTLRMEPANG